MTPGLTQAKGSRREPDPHSQCGGPPLQVAPDLLADEPSVERGDVSGVDRVEKVAGGEDAVGARPQRRVDDGTTVAGVHVDATQSRQLVVGDPVTGEDDDVARDDAADAGRPGPRPRPPAPGHGR